MAAARAIRSLYGGQARRGRRRYGGVMADEPVRGVTFQRRMSDFEALMWNVEKDPWLNPSAGVVVVCDRPPVFEDFRSRIAHAVAEIPRLRERVVPSLGRLSPPSWAPDPEFDLDNHVRHIALPAPGTLRQLFDLAARLMQDPFDRTRPLWLFVIVDEVEDGRGAMFAKLHHTIADGYAALRLAELYLTLERDAPSPPDVDLDRVPYESVDEDQAGPGSGGGLVGVAASAVATGRHLWRRQLGRARRTAGEVLLWGADPRRPVDMAARAVATIGDVRSQVGQSGGVPGGSPLWRRRSRHRHFDVIRVPLPAMAASAKALGGTINDVFVTGAVLGAVRYHDRRETPLEALNISFVVSTRDTGGADTNAFAPTRVQVPAGPMTAEERFAAIRTILAAGRQGARGGGAMTSLAGLANLLPTSLVTSVARSQTAHMDFATSNIRGAPVPTYVSGARILWTGTLGPVAGTAFNLTAMSYDGSFDMGLHVDPMAVDDCDDLRRCIATGFQELLALAGQTLATDHEVA
jgi:diacylglycerol O-acyltransferase / wax synthase